MVPAPSGILREHVIIFLGSLVVQPQLGPQVSHMPLTFPVFYQERKGTFSCFHMEGNLKKQRTIVLEMNIPRFDSQLLCCMSAQALYLLNFSSSPKNWGNSRGCLKVWNTFNEIIYRDQAWVSKCLPPFS